MEKSLGRFEIQRELGRGSQSVVYLAWDEQLQREVAIKTLHFSRPDAQRNAALLEEARAVSRLRHPNLVPLFDVGEEDGNPYLVFEYVEGSNLAELLAREGRFNAARTADLMRQVFDALAIAHASGIIHRDLKPSNILMDAQGRPRVMDFGIAARMDADASAKESSGLSGTLNYLAPEYVESRRVDARSDVYAAGLVTIEMLSGKPPISGDTPAAVVFQILNGTIALPTTGNIDQKLASIILKACARDPEVRTESAAQVKAQLDEYLGAAATPIVYSGAGDSKKVDTLEFLLRRMRHKADFPALSESVAAINKLTRTDRESLNKLSNTILKDYGLTNKILRMVNSVGYRSANGSGISTISRAIIVLGFDALRNIAISVLLFDHLQDRGGVREMKEAFLRANLAATLARNVGKLSMPREAEEAYVCALFHNLGQILSQFYFPEEADEIRRIIVQKGYSDEMASTQILGISFSELGMGVARHWDFPASIIHSLLPLSSSAVRKPATQEEALRVLSGFAGEICSMIASAPKEKQREAIAVVRQRFVAALTFTDEQLNDIIEKSYREVMETAQVLGVNLTQSPFAKQIKTWIGPPTGRTMAVEEDALEGTMLGLRSRPEAALGEDGGNDLSTMAQSILSAGIQDISNALVDNFSLIDILRITLETMYRAMGFQRVLLCLKDQKSGNMVGRFGFGLDANDLARKFSFSLNDAPNVFQTVARKGLDIIISDVADPKIVDRIPAWYHKLISARTFVLFPMIIKDNPVALIYCDRENAGSIVIAEKELTSLKTLRNLALLAIKQSL